MTEPRHTITWRTSAQRRNRLQYYTEVTELTLNDTLNALVDDALDRWEATREELMMPALRSRESAS
jgi:hypothetical protein